MIHVVFQESDIQALEKSFELDDTLRGQVLHIKDDYAVGPLKDIYSVEGIAARKQWWKEVLAGGDYDGLVEQGNVDDEKTANDLVNGLKNNPEEVLWIWAAQNKHDVSGYYWLVSRLKDLQGRIFILYLNNLPFINEKGHIFYPVNLFQIAPREFLKARKLARAVTSSEFETDPEEWKRLCEENKGVRILEGGKKLVQYDDDFYDSELAKFINSDWIRVSKLIHIYLGKALHTTGDAYLLWRLKSMITSGKLDAQGAIRNMKDFEVKAKALYIEPVYN
ncbi:MAG: DUF3658 domain-containing protein [Chitinophagaceae bacterium]